MIASWVVLAVTKSAAPPAGWQSSGLWSTLLVAAAFLGLIVLGLILIAVLGRWRKQPAPVAFDPNEQLAHFRKLYEKGELSQEEFDKIRERLGRELGPQPSVQAPAPAANLERQAGENGSSAAPPPVFPGPQESASPGEATKNPGQQA